MRQRFLIALSLLSFLLLMIVAIIGVENHLPVRMKFRSFAIPLVNSKGNIWSIQIFDGNGVRFCKYAAHNPPIVGPTIGGHAILMKGPNPLMQATVAWERQFGPNLYGDLLGLRWRLGPEFQWPMNIGAILKLGDVVDVTLPCSFLMLLFAPLPLLHWVLPSLRRFGQQSRDSSIYYCEICGYDLRATPNFCPECGTARSETKYPQGGANILQNPQKNRQVYVRLVQNLVHRLPFPILN